MLVVRQALRLIASYAYRFLRWSLRRTHLDRFLLKELIPRDTAGMTSPNRARIQISESIRSQYHGKIR